MALATGMPAYCTSLVTLVLFCDVLLDQLLAAPVLARWRAAAVAYSSLLRTEEVEPHDHQHRLSTLQHPP
jgi:hypothetical protein